MPKILVVDDSAPMRASMRTMLEAIGHEVVEASDGSEGLKRLQENTDCKLAFVDVNMPVMDGLTMIQTVIVNEYAYYPDIPFVVLTTEDNPSAISMAKVAGVKGWCIKPVKQDVVEKLISHILPKEG
ncbi:MAG: response regulator [Oligoflexales bacterium]|nr:response regulator [Oligoflexales bacterium]